MPHLTILLRKPLSNERLRTSRSVMFNKSSWSQGTILAKFSTIFASDWKKSNLKGIKLRHLGVRFVTQYCNKCCNWKPLPLCSYGLWYDKTRRTVISKQTIWRLTISFLFSTKMESFLRNETTSMRSSWFSRQSVRTNIWMICLFFIFISTFKSSARFSRR